MPARGGVQQQRRVASARVQLRATPAMWAVVVAKAWSAATCRTVRETCSSRLVPPRVGPDIGATAKERPSAGGLVEEAEATAGAAEDPVLM